MASDLIREELTNLRMLGNHGLSAQVVSDHLQSDGLLGDLYEKHPVTLQALQEGFRREHIVPISIYFDGVQYTKNENFLGFYMTSLRTTKQSLLWVLRA